MTLPPAGWRDGRERRPGCLVPWRVWDDLARWPLVRKGSVEAAGRRCHANDPMRWSDATVTHSSSTPGQPPPELDTSVAHSARVWNYFLGGKDYFPADQQAAEIALATMPSLVEAARAGTPPTARCCPTASR